MVNRSLVWNNDAKQQKLFLWGEVEWKKLFCLFHIMSNVSSRVKHHISILPAKIKYFPSGIKSDCKIMLWFIKHSKLAAARFFSMLNVKAVFSLYCLQWNIIVKSFHNRKRYQHLKSSLLHNHIMHSCTSTGKNCSIQAYPLACICRSYSTGHIGCSDDNILLMF